MYTINPTLKALNVMTLALEDLNEELHKAKPDTDEVRMMLNAVNELTCEAKDIAKGIKQPYQVQYHGVPVTGSILYLTDLEADVMACELYNNGAKVALYSLKDDGTTEPYVSTSEADTTMERRPEVIDYKKLVSNPAIGIPTKHRKIVTDSMYGICSPLL